MYYIDIRDALYFILIYVVVLEILGMFYRQQIAYICLAFVSPLQLIETVWNE